MRFVKAFGLAALAALATMAFIGTGTASAQHDIVLCKTLATLCAASEVWPTGTLVTALAKEPKLTSSLGTITCEDSYVKGLLENELGTATELKLDSVTVEFGKLPSPSLGTGCTGPCTTEAGSTIHATFENTRILVESPDIYYILGGGLALLLNCPFGVTCVYRSTHTKKLIKHNGTHLLHAGNNLPLAQFEITLERQTTHSGSSLCPATSVWNALYVFTLAEHHASGTSGLAWPSLFKKA